jgi:secretion/DNA translocation related TadE-like protein
MREDNGSGSLLGVAIAGSTVAAMILLVPLYLGLGIRESVASAADASALAAADVAAGTFPGVPCDLAATVATANHAALDACATDGLVVTVRTSVGFLGLTLAATATAGPPVVGTN